MILTSIIVTGLVFNGIGAVIGYVLGYIEAENFYRIKRREILPTLAQQLSKRSKSRQES
jgi:glycopeptide antibiotics resistance protein